MVFFPVPGADARDARGFAGAEEEGFLAMPAIWRVPATFARPWAPVHDAPLAGPIPAARRCRARKAAWASSFQRQSRVDWLLTRRAEGMKELGPLLRTNAEARQEFRLIMAGAFVNAAANAAQASSHRAAALYIPRAIETVGGERMTHAREAGRADDDLAAVRERRSTTKRPGSRANSAC